MQLGSVLSLEAATEAMEENAQRKTASPHNLLHYRDCCLKLDHQCMQPAGDLATNLAMTVPHGLQQLRELSDSQDVF